MTGVIVDVIIPVYNQFDLVRQCIQTVLNSNCTTKFEIVVVDDASTDEQLKGYLRQLESEQTIVLLTNQDNLGFTRTVNFAMTLHTDRDVLLLNSDTLVYGEWLDRIVAGGYSDSRIATVNPLTNQNGSHISCYPQLVATRNLSLEVDDRSLNDLAAQMNAMKYVDVHTTVGFCMYIKRVCLNDIGYFDAVNFPIAYGEESDFCYRAKKVGWRHLIVGDAFVTHLEGKSFSDRKLKLMNDMSRKFIELHPEVMSVDADYVCRDPIRTLRSGLDLGRIKRLLSSRKSINAYSNIDITNQVMHADDVYLLYIPNKKLLKFVVHENEALFPNLDAFVVPYDLAKFNNTMARLGIEAIVCTPQFCFSSFERDIAGLPWEVKISPRLLRNLD